MQQGKSILKTTILGNSVGKGYLQTIVGSGPQNHESLKGKWKEERGKLKVRLRRR